MLSAALAGILNAKIRTYFNIVRLTGQLKNENYYYIIIIMPTIKFKYFMVSCY